MNTSDIRRDLERLQTVLDTFGAEPARWPVAEVSRLVTLIKSDPRAKRMLGDARALDRVLSAAPAGSPSQIAGLTERIVRRAAASSTTAEIVPLPQRLGGPVPASAPKSRRYWPVFAAMAASLAVGFYAGTSELVAPTLQQVAGLSMEAVPTIAPAGQTVADEVPEGELL